MRHQNVIQQNQHKHHNIQYIHQQNKQELEVSIYQFLKI